MKHLARHFEEANGSVAQKFIPKAEEAQRRADLIREALFEHEELSVEKIVAIEE